MSIGQGAVSVVTGTFLVLWDNQSCSPGTSVSYSRKKIKFNKKCQWKRPQNASLPTVWEFMLSIQPALGKAINLGMWRTQGVSIGHYLSSFKVQYVILFLLFCELLLTWIGLKDCGESTLLPFLSLIIYRLPSDLHSAACSQS